MNQSFKKLTPVKDASIDQSHIAAVDFAIKEDDILNVAISGNYGSGKSSFIETYKTKNSEQGKKFLHISLSHFSSGDGEGELPLDSDSLLKNNILEGKIVNQLLHQIDPDKIPLTIFKSKQHPKKKEIYGWSILLFLLLFSILTLWNLDKLFPNHSWNIWIKLGFIVILGLCSFILIYLLTSLQLHRKLFKSISFKGATVSGDIEILG